MENVETVKKFKVNDVIESSEVYSHLIYKTVCISILTISSPFVSCLFSGVSFMLSESGMPSKIQV